MATFGNMRLQNKKNYSIWLHGRQQRITAGAIRLVFIRYHRAIRSKRYVFVLNVINSTYLRIQKKNGFYLNLDFFVVSECSFLFVTPLELLLFCSNF